MAEDRRKRGRMAPEQLSLTDIHAQIGGEDTAVIADVLARLLVRLLAPRADPAIEGLLKSHEQMMMAAFTALSKSLKEATREGIREAVRIVSPPTPPAVSRPPARATPTPRPPGRPRSSGAESWEPTIARQVRLDIDAAAGGTQHRDAFVTEALEAFRKVMRKGVTRREAIVNPFRAQIFQSESKRSRMVLHIRAQWHRQLTDWANRLDSKLAKNHMLEIILRWHLAQAQDGHGQPGGR